MPNMSIMFFINTKGMYKYECCTIPFTRAKLQCSDVRTQVKPLTPVADLHLFHLYNANITIFASTKLSNQQQAPENTEPLKIKEHKQTEKGQTKNF